MEAIAYDPYVDAEETLRRGARKVELDELLRSADFVSINCPLTDETRGMIGAREYALMKPTAYFITTARGLIHDEAALEAALRDKTIAGAGLDVWGKEPPAVRASVARFDNVIVTAHTAGVTREARANIGRIAAEQMLDALDGKPVTHRQSAGLAGLRQTLRAHVRLCRAVIPPPQSGGRSPRTRERRGGDAARPTPTPPHHALRASGREIYPVYSRMCMPWPQRSIR